MAIRDLWGGKKEDADDKNKEAVDPKAVKEAKDKFREMELPKSHIKVSRVAPLMYEGKRVEGTGQVIKTWKSNEIKTGREIEEFIESSYGGGIYDVKYVDAVSGDVLYSTKITIDQAEFPPRVEHERDPAAERGYGPNFPHPQQAHEGGLDSKTMVELVMSTNNTNMEALKLMMEQSRIDQANRKDDANLQMKMIVDTMKEAFASASKSQDATTQMMLQSKTEQMELMKMIIEDNKNAGADQLKLVIDMFTKGMEIGNDTGAAPKSDLAEIMGTIANAFSNVVAMKNNQPVAQPVKVLPPVSKPKPLPNRKPAANPVQMDDPNAHQISEVEKTGAVVKLPSSQSGSQKEVSGVSDEVAGQDSNDEEDVEFVDSDPDADDLLKKLIEVVKTRPEKPGVLAYVISKTPKDKLIEFHTTGDTTPIFNWLATTGDSELVAELTELLSIEDNKRWIKETMEDEGQALVAQNQETK